MPIVTFLPDNRTVEVPAGTDLLAVAARAGLHIDTECGGKGTCRSCLTRVKEGAVAGESEKFLSREVLDAGDVLACLSRVGETPLVLQLAASTQEGQGHFAEAVAESESLLSNGKVPSSFVQRLHLTVAPPRQLDGLCDVDRVLRCLPQRGGPVHMPLGALRQAAAAVRGAGGLATGLVYADTGRTVLFDLAAGHTTATTRPLYGAAVDIGTTSVAVSLIDMENGRVLATASDYNGQTAYGLDVIARINYARRPEGLKELRIAVRKTANGLLRQTARAAGLAADDIAALSVAGNTVMTHLLLGLDPEHIRLDPYTPTVFCPSGLCCRDLGLAGMPDAPVLFGASVGSYVGGDISSGLLCTDIHASAGVILYIDIGTNGEIALGNRDFLMACACSAGPAFEGGELACGMRAADGAIERVAVLPADATPTCTILGAEKAAIRARGVCGTGVISAMAELFATGWLDAAGKLCRERPSPAITIEGRRASYTLVHATASETGRSIVLTEVDMESVLRAKAAIYAGCSYLLEQAGLEFQDLASVVVAGGFGRFLDVEQSVTIGLLPDLPRERFVFVGNGSRKGAGMALVSADKRRLRAELAQRMTYIDLSTAAGYMNHFTAALFLPHTDRGSFPSVIGGKGT